MHPAPLRRSAAGPTLLFLLAASACDRGGSSDSDGSNSAGTSAGGAATAGTSAGGAGTGGTGAGSTAAGHGGAVATGGSTADLVIDDFEDGDGVSLLTSVWYEYTDVDNGGGSTLTIPGATSDAFSMTGEGFQSMRSLAVEYTFDRGALTYDPYVGFGVALGSSAAPRDLSAYEGLAYTYRGGAHSVRIETFDVKDYDYFGVAMPASAAWRTVTLPFSVFQQEGWGDPVSFDRSNIGALSFHVRGTDGTTGQLQIDDLVAVAKVPMGPPDFMLNEPQPPTRGVIDSIAIENPLQAKALRYLSRGYNITNWLEQSRFSGFEYDEAYVEKLAAAGFKSLRLPIDLDLYVESTQGSGDALTVTVHDDLFQVLDAFDGWTAKHGLSLTIDYHEYDKSITLADADSVSKAVALWGKVAEHFAASPREDLFYELLNEPELSFGGQAPTQAQWTAVAERMVAAIRAHDDAHTIIFGDVEWYGIGPLSRREPLSDTNVIYAFHDYEPFIFTHQGASWANMSTTHDIPYPYSVDRWSEYSSALGFTPATEPWIMDAARNYYRTGNRESLRNGVLAAKRWAVQHGVPVICNEFGAFDGTSRLEDRARYYADIIGVFEELEIPWQQWFMVMNGDGQVIPEYRAAFRLDEP